MSGQHRFGARLRGAWLRRALRVGAFALGAWASAFALGMYMRHTWSWLLSLSPILLGPAFVLSFASRIRLELGEGIRHRGFWPSRDWALTKEEVASVEEAELWPERDGVRLLLCLRGGAQRITEPLDPEQIGPLKERLGALSLPLREPPG